MKKIFTFFLALVASIGTIFAVKVQIGDLYYNLNVDNQTAEVTCQYDWSENNYLGLITANIPAYVTYNGVAYSVTSIGYAAFYGCRRLTSVVIPDSVTNIEYYAFQNCSSLTSIEIPNSVTIIGEMAFYDCTNLTSVTIPNSVTYIGQYAFSGCTSLPVIDNVRYADTYLIEAVDKSLSSYTIKEGTKWIGEEAFGRCTGLTSVEIPNSVINIGGYAFQYCTSLTTVTIGNNVLYIYSDAFEGCRNITSVVWNAVNCNTYNFGSQVTSFTFGENVAVIPAELCLGMYRLVDITIPNSVTSIGDRVFYNCDGLISVTMGSTTPPTLGENVFISYKDWVYKILNLSIYVPCGTLNAFKTANKWSTYASIIEYMPQPYTIMTSATNGSVSVPQNICEDMVTAIPDKGYHFVQWSDGNTDNPRTIELTQDTTFAAEFAVSMNGQCGDNLQWSLDDSILTIVGTGNMWNEEPWVISQKIITQVVFPEGITSIGDSSFAGCNRLTSITIPKNVASIGEGAFDSCSNISSVVWNAVNSNSWNFGSQVTSFTFGDNVEVIPAKLCLGMSLLTDIVIPNSVTSIGDYAFEDCSSLISVIIPNNVTSVGALAFYGCNNLNSVVWNAKNCSDLFYEEYSHIIIMSVYSTFPTTVKSFIFGNEVEHIPANICRHMNHLTSLTIPNSVTSIGTDAFKDCYALKELTLNSNSIVSSRYLNDVFGDQVEEYHIGDEVTRVGDWAFYACPHLTSVTIGNSVTSIGDCAFDLCGELTYLTIGSSVTSIGSYAFYNCVSLQKIYNHGQNPADVSYSTTFDGVNKSSCTLYVPRGSINKYKNAAVWRDFYNIEPLENVEAIEDVIDSHNGSSEGMTKVFRDGQILILRGDKTYTMQGQEVR